MGAAQGNEGGPDKTAAAITEREEEKEAERETGVSVTGGETRVTQTIMHIEENTRTGYTQRATHLIFRSETHSDSLTG